MNPWRDYAVTVFDAPGGDAYRLLLEPGLGQTVCVIVDDRAATLRVCASSPLLWDYLGAKRIMALPHKQDRALSGFVHAMDHRAKKLTDLAARLEAENPPNIDHTTTVDGKQIAALAAAMDALPAPDLAASLAPPVLTENIVMDGLTVTLRYLADGETRTQTAQNPAPDSRVGAIMTAFRDVAGAVVDDPALRALLQPLLTFGAAAVDAPPAARKTRPAWVSLKPKTLDPAYEYVALFGEGQNGSADASGGTITLHLTYHDETGPQRVNFDGPTTWADFDRLRDQLEASGWGDAYVHGGRANHGLRARTVTLRRRVDPANPPRIVQLSR